MNKNLDDDKDLVAYFQQVIAMREAEEIDWFMDFRPPWQAAPAAGGGLCSPSERHSGG